MKDVNKKLSNEFKHLSDQVEKKKNKEDENQEIIKTTQSRADTLKKRITKERLDHADASAISNQNKKFKSMMKDMIDCTAELQIDYDAMEEVSIAMW